MNARILGTFCVGQRAWTAIYCILENIRFNIIIIIKMQHQLSYEIWVEIDSQMHIAHGSFFLTLLFWFVVQIKIRRKKNIKYAKMDTENGQLNMCFSIQRSFVILLQFILNWFVICNVICIRYSAHRPLFETNYHLDIILGSLANNDK